MNRLVQLFAMLTIASLVLTGHALYGQAGTTAGGGGPVTAAVSLNNMSLQNRTFVCGGKVQQGTPIAGLGGTSGSISLNVPGTGIVRADLFWTILVNALPTNVGQAITFDNGGGPVPIVGTQIGTAPQSACFPQTSTVSYRADVTALAVLGLNVYTVGGFPASSSGGPLVEGVTLQVLFSDPNGPLKEDVLFHTNTGGLLAVTQGELFSQLLSGFQTNAAGPVMADLFTVIGNGQSNAGENLRFDSPAVIGGSGVNLDNTLDGSTSSNAARTCPLSPVAAPECFWDDDVINVAGVVGNSATLAELQSNPAISATFDCFDWTALDLLVSTDEARVCAEGGQFVDAACPPIAVYRNHGAYLSCVAHAAEQFLAGLPEDGTCARAEIQSCIVNPRARSGVGKPSKP